MKPQSLHKLLITLIVTAGMFLTGIGAQAQALGPIAGPDVDTAIAGRPNLALASGGATTFASSELAPAYGPTLVNDGIIANAWIAATSGNGEYVAVAFPSAVTLGAIVFKSDYGWRSWGTWSLQYTTNGSPGTGTTNWTQIGTYSWASGDPLPRLYFEFASISNVTAIRLVISDVYAGQNCVQELEAYGATPLPAAIPPGMSPLVVGAGVDTAIGGRTNWALASGGGIAFASSQIGASFGPEKANNGIIDSIVEPFIPATPATTEYLGIAFPTNIT
jgi:hypothetical protein